MATLVDSAREEEEDLFDFAESISGVCIIGFVACRKRTNNYPVKLRHRVFFYSLRIYSCKNEVSKSFFLFQCSFLYTFYCTIKFFRSYFDAGSDLFVFSTEMCLMYEVKLECLLGCFNDNIPTDEAELCRMRDIASCSK